jgi:transcriptional regulator with XRE-family HTH domain
MAEKFGEKLRKLRTSKGLTLEELAAVIGSSKAYIWQLENKTNAKPSAELLLKIANYFSESPEFFLDDGQNDPSDRHVGQVEDAFFRKFKKLSESDKRTIERIASGFDDED